jgi:lipoprotein-releasing system ATP-binding protein
MILAAETAAGAQPPAAQSSELLAEEVRKEFPSPKGPLVILSRVNLRATPDAPVAILGPSGSGKSTLLHILGALEPPSSGRVRLDGVDPHSLSEGEQARFRNRKVGFVFQEHHLLPQLTTLENVLIPTLVREDRGGDDLPRATALLSRVGLGERFGHRPAELSGGERQRTAIARALMGRPLLLLADEPTGNLDRRTAAEVGALLLDLQREERTILIVVTHSLELAARFSRKLELEGGELREV